MFVTGFFNDCDAPVKDCGVVRPVEAPEAVEPAPDGLVEVEVLAHDSVVGSGRLFGFVGFCALASCFEPADTAFCSPASDAGTSYKVPSAASFVFAFCVFVFLFFESDESEAPSILLSEAFRFLFLGCSSLGFFALSS